MPDLIDPAFIAQQQAQHPDLDVWATAGAVREYASRQHVANPPGLLVHWLTKQERSRQRQLAKREAADTRELERYAELWVELLHLASTRRLAPADLARCIEAARAGGFTKLNPCLEPRLRTLAARGGWPGAP